MIVIVIIITTIEVIPVPTDKDGLLVEAALDALVDYCYYYYFIIVFIISIIIVIFVIATIIIIITIILSRL